MSTPTYSAAELAAHYQCAIVPQQPHFAAELIVLPVQAPVTLKAELRLARPLPAGYRQTGVRMIWAASAGAIRPLDEATTPGLALFTPPAESRRLTINVLCEIELRAHGAAQGQKITSTAALQFLTPLPSAGNLQGEMLDGYHVGHYLTADHPEELEKYNIRSDWFKRHPIKYEIPTYFYKVDAAAKPLKIAPDVTLGTFVIDFPWKTLGMPQYIALDLTLVQKLEDLMALMRADGIRISQFKAIYGFRPPSFNLGTISEHPGSTLKEPLSMHQYGRALDLIIDEDDDGQLDDLNGDGKFDVYDAGVIMHYVNLLDRQYRAEGRMDLVGGAGLYWDNDFTERNQYYAAHHPRHPKSTAYVHVDTRGFTAEGGRLIRWSDKSNEAWPDGTLIQWSNPNKEYWSTAEHRGALPMTTPAAKTKVATGSTGLPGKLPARTKGQPVRPMPMPAGRPATAPALPEIPLPLPSDEEMH